MRSWWTTLNIVALLVALSAPALAQDAPAEAKKPKVGVSRILKTMDWKASTADVLDLVKAELDERYAKKIGKFSDTLTVDRILREKRDAFAKIKKGQVFFDGSRSGYEASVVGEEFRANNGESLIRVDDDLAQRYYFFQNDALWKIVVVYNSSISRKVDFAGFVKQITGNYGASANMDWHTPPGGTRTLRGATWSDEITHLAVEDQREFFGTYLMRFVDKTDGMAIEARRKGGDAKSAGGGSDFADGMMADIMGDDDGASSADVVDQLTGSNHDVDLTTGRPKDDTVVLDRTDQVIEAKRRSKKTRRARSKKKAGSPEPAPPKSDEPYIIY